MPHPPPSAGRKEAQEGYGPMTGQVGEPLSHGSGFTELSWKLTISLVWEPEALTSPLLGRLLRPSYMSLSRGAPMTFSRGWNPPGGRAEPFSSQPCWDLSCKRALEWKTRAEGQPRALREQVAEASGPWKEGQSCPCRGGHSSPGPEGPGRGRSEDMAISSGYSRGAHSF